MDITDKIANLIINLEPLIARECYNPNSYNGWTGEEGCNYRYPLQYCENKNKLKKREASTTRRKVEAIDKDCVCTMKYRFGSNHLYIGDGIANMLEFLEKRYDIDFEKLEEELIRVKIDETNKIKELLESGEPVNFNPGTYVIGIDIPEGSYYVSKGRSNYYSSVELYNTRGKMSCEYWLEDNQAKRIILKNNYRIRTFDDFWLSINKDLNSNNT